MSNLVPFNNNGLELVIDNTTGESFASISAVARMTDKDKSLISRYVNGGLKTVARMALKMAEINTTTGLKTVALLTEDQMLEVIKRYKPELLEALNKPALRMYLHHLAGYTVTSDAIIRPKSRKQAVQNLLGDLAQDKCFNPTLGKKAMEGTLEDQVELGAKDEKTEISGMLMAVLRLTLEDDKSMHEPKCRRTMTKQLRRTQMKLEGVDSVPDHMCTKKELKDKQKALENNPSSKENALPDVRKIADEIAESKKLKAKEQPKLAPGVPEGFVIDIPMDDIKY
jgi:hypothetical protein